MAAEQAFPRCSTASPEIRADLLDRVGDALLKRNDELSYVLSREQGKILVQGIGEIVRAGGVLKAFLQGNLAAARAEPGLRASRSRLTVRASGLWPDQPLEFSDRYSGLESRAGAGRWQHRSAQACRTHPRLSRQLCRTSVGNVERHLASSI
jgi:Aldehyde dehydrogenase family